MYVENKNILSDEKVDKELEGLEGWEREGSVISKAFIFEDFQEINSFLKFLVDSIIEKNHHPDFNLDTGKRTINISLTTHSENAVTVSDIDFARNLNSWT